MNGGDHTGEDTGGGDDRILAGEYALGVLDADQARAFEARMAAEPELRILYAAWAEAFAAMTDPIADVPPPPAAWSGIEARLFAPARAPARRLRRLGWLAGAAAAALAALMKAVRAETKDKKMTVHGLRHRVSDVLPAKYLNLPQLRDILFRLVSLRRHSDPPFS